MRNAIDVLILDDSAEVRDAIGSALRRQPGLHVIGTTDDARQAAILIDQLRPDVVLLGVGTAARHGLPTLDAASAFNAVPLLMISGETPAEAAATLAALDRGAIDFVVRPDDSSPSATAAEEWARKIRCAVGVDLPQSLQVRRERAVRHPGTANWPASQEMVPPYCFDACIVVGTATGGPPALAALLAELRPPLPPMAVVQHLPPVFITQLAERLNQLTELEVKEAVDGDEFVPNRVLLAPGGKHLQLRRRGGRTTARVLDFEPVSGQRPSADVLFLSAAELYRARTIGMIMTGAGRDGVAGCAAVRACGGYVLGQAAACSDVYGMNRDAFLEGYVDRQFTMSEAAAVLRRAIELRFAGNVC